MARFFLPFCDLLSTLLRVDFFILFLQREGAVMLDRLMSCGFTRELAERIIADYGDDKEGLASYVRFIELLYDDRCEYV